MIKKIIICFNDVYNSIYIYIYIFIINQLSFIRSRKKKQNYLTGERYLKTIICLMPFHVIYWYLYYREESICRFFLIHNKMCLNVIFINKRRKFNNISVKLLETVTCTSSLVWDYLTKRQIKSVIQIEEERSTYNSRQNENHTNTSTYHISNVL